jgi:protocatechuate 3,4-dioxygenase beta subunit
VADVDDQVLLTRRRVLELGLALPLPLLAGAGGRALAAGPLQATQACDDGDDDPTLPQTEGPFYTPRTPRRRSLLEPGLPGTRLTLAGYVLTTRCRPVPGALLDFWQADARGVYDNDGFRLRGHQRTDALGRYRLETVVPGLYPGRTRHIHVKVQASARRLLTTQLYFPGEPRNRSDGIFQPELLVRWRKIGTRRTARFDFVIDLA